MLARFARVLRACADSFLTGGCCGWRWWARRSPLARVLLAGAALRIFLIVLGEVLDNAGLRYTDIDYGVVVDGARAAAAGGSPFDRATYRYSPLLALAAAPALAVPWAGKAIFAAADLVGAALVARLIAARGMSASQAAACAAALALHPFVANVSTRGNSDALACALVLAVLACLLGGRRLVDAAAALLGLAVHMRIYPVIYVLPLTAFLDAHYAPEDFAVPPPADEVDPTVAKNADLHDMAQSLPTQRSRSRSSTPLRRRRHRQVKEELQQHDQLPPLHLPLTDRGSLLCFAFGAPFSAVLRLAIRAAAVPFAAATGRRRDPSAFSAWLTTSPLAWPWRRVGVTALPSDSPLAALQWVHDFATPRRLGFGALSFTVFACLTGICYAAYGWPFLYEAFLYHFVRADNRHNFSPRFYDLYLNFENTHARAAGAGLLAMLPQLGALAVAGAALYRDPPAALLLQTAVFVIWNKVITVQYFNWYLALAPLILPQSMLVAGVVRGDARAVAAAAVLSLAWLLTEVRCNGGGARRLFARACSCRLTSPALVSYCASFPPSPLDHKLTPPPRVYVRSSTGTSGRCISRSGGSPPSSPSGLPACSSLSQMLLSLSHSSPVTASCPRTDTAVPWRCPPIGGHSERRRGGGGTEKSNL